MRNFDGIPPLFDPFLFILDQRNEAVRRALAEPEGLTQYTPTYYDMQGKPVTPPDYFK